jgi:hypothetical protein
MSGPDAWRGRALPDKGSAGAPPSLLSPPRANFEGASVLARSIINVDSANPRHLVLDCLLAATLDPLGLHWA